MENILPTKRSGKYTLNNNISKEMFDYLHWYNEITKDDISKIIDDALRLHAIGTTLKTMPGKVVCDCHVNTLISNEMRQHIDIFCASIGIKKGRLLDYALRLHRQEYGSKVKA